MSKAQKLAEYEGFNSPMELLADVGHDSVVPGICMNKDCDYVSLSMEPDQGQGYCEECGTNTVKSIHRLVGCI